jgi:hypothetical protein
MSKDKTPLGGAGEACRVRTDSRPGCVPITVVHITWPCVSQPLTLPDTTPIDEDLHRESGVGWLVAVEQKGVAAQGRHLGSEDHSAL